MEERRLNPHNNRIVQVCIEEVALSPSFLQSHKTP